MKKLSLHKQKNVERYNVDSNFGLSDEQVNNRKDQGLVNKISKTVTKSYFKIIWDNIFNFFNLLLAAISIFMLTGDPNPSKFMFMYLLIINIAIGLYQDIKARRKVDKLRVISYPIVKVIRNGNELLIPANELVLDDVVILENGNQIIADSTIIEGEIEVNESLLTGESNNILKKVGDTVLSGSYLTSGHAKARVEKVGRDNYAESLQRKAKTFKRPKSEILLSINRIFKLILSVVIVLGTAMIVTYITNGGFKNDYNTTVDNFGGSMVAMIPTGMYLLVSLTLAVGVIRLSKKRMLVQELYCIETLARVDTLCLDKTGTITDGTMSLNSFKCFNGYVDNDIKHVLVTLVSATNDQNATAKAIKNAFDGLPIFEFTKSLPFNSARKFSAVMLSDGRCFVLGAREFLPHHNSEIDKFCLEHESRGHRVLLLGMTKRGFDTNEPIPELEEAAVIVFEEHIKEDAIEKINWFKNNGVNIKIISGDNPVSVSSIAERVGINDSSKFISLEGMSVEEVKQIANQYTIFGRVSPEQKEAIVRALQDEKHVVAMTGDGVNDILALKAADCSIAMGSGSDAAKSIAHLVSLDSNFSSLPDVVSEGRRVINNLQRTCSVFLVKTLFAMVFTIIFLISSWCGGPNYPFVTNNLYLWELLTIGLASFFLSLQPNNERIKRSFLYNIITKTIPGAFVQIVFVGIIYLIQLCDSSFMGKDLAITMSFFVFTFISYLTLIIISRPYDKYRVALSIGIGLLIVILIMVDRFAIYPSGDSFFKIEYSLINESNWWVLFLELVLSIPFYFFVDFLMKKIQKYIVLKKEI